MTDNVADKPSRKRRKWLGCMASIIFIFALALISLSSTFGMWDGAFPDAEYHLQIQDQAGNPIEGAVLNVYKGRSKQYAFEYPFDNYSSENSLVSNADGEIIVTHLPRGFEFGGPVLHLFWIIPISSGAPKFTCKITADGYKPYQFSAQQIFDVGWKAYSGIYNKNYDVIPRKTIQIDGHEYRLMILEKSIILKKK